jgi:hypothetical protein
MTVEAIEVLRDRKGATPAAANGRVKAIRQVFKWGIRKKLADGRPYAPNNPARDEVGLNRLSQLDPPPLPATLEDHGACRLK